jgi:calcineurin-like phosphoesterase family protein
MRWFTSDLHVGHSNIILFSNRPFWQTPAGAEEYEESLLTPDVEAMNRALRDNYNDVVADDDEVWFVGDIAMGRQQTTVPFFKQFKGRKILIPGNHDACHPMWGKYKKFIPLYKEAGFEIMPLQVMTHIAGHSVRVCHFPWWEDFVHNTRDGHAHKVDKFSGLRPENDGAWLVHGHTHSPERVTKDRQIHVGVDAWDYMPVSEDQIAEIISS